MSAAALSGAQELRAQTYRGTHLRDSRGVYAWKDERFPSITTLLKQMDKPALPRWSAKMVAEHVAEFVTEIVPKQKIGWPMIQKYLGDVEELKQIPWKYAEKRRDIGSNLHDIAEQVSGGVVVNPDVFADDLRPLVKSHLDFCTIQQPDFEAMETGCFNRAIGYACTLDTIVRLPKFGNVRAVMDYKTGKDVYEEAVIQVNAQRVAEFIGLRDGTELPMISCEKNMVLLVQEAGWKLFECPIVTEIDDVLRALVTLYNFKKAAYKPAEIAAQETN
ncbi:MAG: hypothetical protein E6Q97_29790 [Desulfurellales bacterium]|nr:MAG: hypothetical protein E6Q97_29790 [Desulfurellales bacterium]